MSKLSRKVVHVKSGVRFQPVIPEVVAPSQYPHEWFVNHPKTKPPAHYHTGGLKPEELTGAIKHGINTNKLNVNLAKYFLVEYSKKLKARLDQDWDSYQIKIGEKGEEVTPMSLINVTSENSTIAGASSTDAAKEEDDWLIFFVLAPHRLINDLEDNYRTAIVNRILKLVLNVGFTSNALPVLTGFDSWNLDTGYTTIVAAYDMFLSKFPTHPNSTLRICTLRSRYRDCACLLSVGHICRVLSLKDEACFLDWLWSEKLGHEMTAMINPAEEIGKSDSYFPYQADMGLVLKTYYSASKCPELYFFIHSVCTLVHSKRSINAKYLTDDDVVSNAQLAKMMAYAFSSSFEFSKE